MNENRSLARHGAASPPRGDDLLDMPASREKSTHRRLQVVIGLALAGLFVAEYQLSRGDNAVSLQKYAIILPEPLIYANAFDRLIRTDPLAALKDARERHRNTVSDYSCVFVKQEILSSGNISDEQEIHVKFRARPYSVVMNWTRNPGLAQRVVYVKNRWIDESAKNPDEREQAVCRPIPPLDRLIKSIKQPIRGSRAKAASRRCIDEFGFERSLDLLIEYCDLARARNELKLEFKGESEFDGRPTWVIQRNLPYTREGGRYPDRVAEVHIDQEYKIPVAVYCYADDEKTPERLLGKYEYRDIRIDVGFTDRDFEPSTYGM